MKSTIALAIACLALHAVPAVHAQGQAPAAARTQAGHEAPAAVRAQLEAVLKNYERALNTGDAAAAAQLYTDDGVLLAPEAPSAVGLRAVHEAYTGAFKAIGLDIRFQVEEAKLLSPEWAMLRTNSTGTIKILANGARIPEGNQELFLLRRTDAGWKIARYSFSTFLRPAS